ncbi:MAG: hypothetical protein J5927_06845 [Oscillospiraceae bacterium]|nr:hypothetical protein [Oscillospiraceae bacterium]
MRRRWLFLPLALFLLVASHVQLSYRVTVDGEPLEGCYSPAQLRQCRELAAQGAAELLADPGPGPELRRQAQLSFSGADGDTTRLSRALLLGYPELCLADGVFVNGVQLGTVADGAVLYDRLRQAIGSQMPSTAVSGNISGRLQIRKVYSRVGHETAYEDMILLITGVAPVLYVDSSGCLV